MFTRRREKKLNKVKDKLEKVEEDQANEDELRERLKTTETEIKRVKRITARLDNRVELLEKQAKVITRES